MQTPAIMSGTINLWARRFTHRKISTAACRENTAATCTTAPERSSATVIPRNLTVTIGRDRIAWTTMRSSCRATLGPWRGVDRSTVAKAGAWRNGIAIVVGIRYTRRTIKTAIVEEGKNCFVECNNIVCLADLSLDPSTEKLPRQAQSDASISWWFFSTKYLVMSLSLNNGHGDCTESNFLINPFHFCAFIFVYLNNKSSVRVCKNRQDNFHSQYFYQLIEERRITILPGAQNAFTQFRLCQQVFWQRKRR